MPLTIENFSQVDTGKAAVEAFVAKPDTTTRVRVLAIDDNEDFCNSLQQLLEPHGFDVKTYSDPVKALEMYTRDKEDYQLVLLDFYMPNLDGEKTSLWLRKLNPNVRIIVVSGAEALRLRQLQAKKLIDDYIRKPFRTEEALFVIRQVMGQPPKPV